MISTGKCDNDNVHDDDDDDDDDDGDENYDDDDDDSGDENYDDDYDDYDYDFIHSTTYDASYLNFVRTAFESTPEQDLERYTRKLERRKLELCVSREMMLSIKSNLLMKINELDAVLSEVPFCLRYMGYCC